MKRFFSICLTIALVIVTYCTPAAYAEQGTDAGVSRGKFMNMLYDAHVKNGGLTVYEQFPPLYLDMRDDEGNVIERNVPAPGTGFAGSAMSFMDVGFSDNCFESTGWGFYNGIVEGVKADRTGVADYQKYYFDPDASVTREQAAVILHRYSECMGVILSATQEGGVFSDADAISDWAAEAVEAMYRAEIMIGKSDGLFDPKGELTLPEAFTVLDRLFSALSALPAVQYTTAR